MRARRRTNRTASSSRPAARWGGRRTTRSGIRRGRNGSISSPRARAWIRAPSSPNRATSAERASSATAPIRRSPNRASRARTSGSGVSSPAGYGARNAASRMPRAARAPRCGAVRTAPRSAGGRRGERLRSAMPSAVAADRVPAIPARAASGRTVGARRSAARRGPARDPTAARARRPGPRTARTPDRAGSTTPGQAGAECRERLEGGLDGRPVRVRFRIDEGRLGDQSMGAPERDPAPDAERRAPPDPRR